MHICKLFRRKIAKMCIFLDHVSEKLLYAAYLVGCSRSLLNGFLTCTIQRKVYNTMYYI